MSVEKKDKVYSRKEMLQLTGKSIAGAAMLGVVPTVLAGCNDDSASSDDNVDAAASNVEDQEVVFTPDEEVCSTEIRYSVKDGKISGLEVDGGCDGNLSGISALVEGMTPEHAAERMKGITCSTGGTQRSSSCPDQISKSLFEII